MMRRNYPPMSVEKALSIAWNLAKETDYEGGNLGDQENWYITWNQAPTLMNKWKQKRADGFIFYTSGTSQIQADVDLKIRCDDGKKHYSCCFNYHVAVAVHDKTNDDNNNNQLTKEEKLAHKKKVKADNERRNAAQVHLNNERRMKQRAKQKTRQKLGKKKKGKRK